MAREERLKAPRFIPTNPCLSLGSILGRRTGIQSSILDNGIPQGLERILTYSGSAALAAAARGLKQVGRDHLLTPSYNCGGEIEPFVREGFEVDAYRVDRNGVIDLDDLESRIRGDRQVVMITHFFGFPGDVEGVRTLCDERGSYLLEDCAHALLCTVGDRWLGSWGDLSIFSLKKSLPTPDGGCLVLNSGEIPGVPPAERAPFFPVYRKATRLLIENMFLRTDGKSRLGFSLLQGLRKALLSGEILLKSSDRKSRFRIEPDIDSFDYDSSVLEYRMSRPALSVLERIDAVAVKRRRQNNYRYVQQALDGLRRLRPFFEDLPEGVCPLKFPLIAPEDHPQAASVMKQYPLVYQWWPFFHPSVRWEDFPESQWLKENCFVIEIHQDMEIRHLDILIDYALDADRAMK